MAREHIKKVNSYRFEKQIELIHEGIDCYFNGDFLRVKEIVKEIGSKSKLPSLYKIRLSRLFVSLDRTNEALEILNQKANISTLLNNDDAELRQYLRYIYLLSYTGATYTAKRLIEKFNSVLEDRITDLEKVRFNGYASLGYVEHELYNFNKSLSYFELFKEKSPELYKNYRLMHLIECEAYTFTNQKRKALRIINQLIESSSDSVYLLARSYLRRGECYLYFDDFDLAFKDFETSSKYFSKMNLLNKEFGFLQLEYAKYYFKKKNEKLSSEYINRALSIFLNNKSTSCPRKILEAIYWKEQIKGKIYDVSDAITLRSHKIFSPYSCLKGRYIEESVKERLPLKIQENYITHNFDCWVIKNNSLKEKKYNSIKVKGNQGRVIDLTSGVVLENGEVLEILTPAQHLVLQILIPSASVGSYEWIIFDYLYKSDIFYADAGRNRVNKMINTLRTKGYSISRKDNHFFFEREKDVTYILPTNHEAIGIEHFIFKNMERFQRSDIEDLLKVSMRTANRVVNSLFERGLTNKVGSGSYVEYVKK